jgi:hypothetical protein
MRLRHRGRTLLTRCNASKALSAGPRTLSAVGPKRTTLVASHMSAFGVKRTWLLRHEMAGFDPKRTLAWIAAIRIVEPEAVLEQLRWSPRY